MVDPYSSISTPCCHTSLLTTSPLATRHYSQHLHSWPCPSKHRTVTNAFHTHDHSLTPRLPWSRSLPLVANMVVIFILHDLHFMLLEEKPHAGKHKKQGEENTENNYFLNSEKNNQNTFFFLSMKTGLLRTQEMQKNKNHSLSQTCFQCCFVFKNRK